MATVTKIIPKDGTTYGVDESGAVDIVTRYQVVLSAPLGNDEILTSFSVTSGGVTTAIPTIGTPHPARRGYYVSKYDVKQPEGSSKSTLDVTVHYSPINFNTDGSSSDPQDPEWENIVEQWGWDDGTSQRELVTAMDASKTPVLNSAKDPFDTVPQVETPAPTFTKVIRGPARRSGWFNYNCKVNDATVNIGGVSFPAGTLLCTIAETIDISNLNWPYKYSIRLRYRSNKALIAGETSNLTECGWDAVVTDAGMREIDSTTGELKLIQVVSSETGQAATVTSPELLNGSGQAVTRGSGSSTVAPYNFRFQAYERATFPGWFYSQPVLPSPPSSTP